MRADGTFIAVEVDDAAAADAELARKLTEACPVDIFAQGGDGALEIVQRNVDECVLCRLCLDAADGWGPGPAVTVVKLYDGGAVLA
jgi:ferredoxin-like protein FixX